MKIQQVGKSTITAFQQSMAIRIYGTK